MKLIYKPDEIPQLLRAKIGTASQREFAKSLSISHVAIQGLLDGIYKPSPKLAAKLGLELVYRKVR